jgi:hypothetical protein
VGSSPSFGTAGQFLTSQGNAASPTWTSGGTGTVTSVGWTGGIVSVATATTTPAFTIAGTSGGIPYFSSGTTWASSAALTANGVVYGGGAGAAPAATAAGTTGQFLGANTGGAPTWQSVTASAGSTTQVIYNSSGTLTGSANMTFNGTALTLLADATINSITVGRGGSGLNSCVAVGRIAMASATGSTDGATAVGNNSLNLNTGNANTAIGANSGAGITTGTVNTCVGVSAGFFPTALATGTKCIFIGANSCPSTTSATYQIVIGNDLAGKGDNTAFIGGTSGAYNGANTTTWAVISDQRIKTNIVSVSDSLAKINALRPVEFNYKESGKHDIGFIAQEFEQVFPDQIIHHDPNEIEKQWVGEDKVKAVQQNLVPFLVKAIQELTARIAVLEAK